MNTIRDSLSRRDLLKLSAAGALGTSVSGWFDALATEAIQQRAKSKACILLWIDGGPSQAHTFDLKPSVKGYENNKGIATAVPGIEISENLPELAKQMRHLAVLRSMSTSDGNHGSAHYLMRTGFRKGVGGIAYPHMGAVVAGELGRADAVLPKFVVIKTGSGYTQGFGWGHLQASNAPVILGNREVTGGFQNLKPGIDMTTFDKRAKYLDEADLEFFQRYQSTALDAHRTGYQQAVRLMHSEDAATKPFKLEEEPEKTRKLYGDSPFGKECLLARRLVEAGSQFVEVVMPGWDSHGGGDNRQPRRVKELDGPYAALIADLKQRGLLDSTLVIWMGEFGRDTTGNNHHAKAWTTVLAGAGLKTGQVVGRTDKHAMTVEDRPISVGDYLATIFKALDIDYRKSYKVNDRPIGMVAKNPGGADAQPVKQLFG